MNEQWVEPVSGRTAFRFDHHAMNTIFGLWLVHPDQTYAEQASVAAFAELDRLESQLSRFLPNSEISQINALKKFESVVVSEDTLRCIQDCMELYQLTKGAFDISAGPLIDRWKKAGDKASVAEDLRNDVNKLRHQTGMPWLQLDDASYQVTMMADGMFQDLGGYGKGYALDVMAEVLKEWGINEALLHGGYSSVLAYSLEKDTAWPVSVHFPGEPSLFNQTIQLCNQSVSGSGIRKGTHIVDPRTGNPVKNRLASWVIGPRAGQTDALSTAFLIMDLDAIGDLCGKDPSLGALIIGGGNASLQTDIHRFGNWL